MFLLVLGNNANPGYEKNVCSIRNRLNAIKGDEVYTIIKY